MSPGLGGPGTTAMPSSGIATSLAALRDAIAAGRDLDLDVSGPRAVLDEASARLGLAADAYVLALVGGTGVGKSSLLNALAGATVSEAGVRRPTTAHPVAWVATSAAAAMAPVLERLGPIERRLHDDVGLAGVVVLDLPDTDSLEPAHRSIVEALLPRVDAVAWVTDPEKYADAILHDAFLRTWLPRLARQVIVLNKADRLAPADLERVRHDLERLARLEVASSAVPVPTVLPASATAGGAGIAPVRQWLETVIDAKTIVAGRVAAAAADAVHELALRAGVDASTSLHELLPTPRRDEALRAAVTELVRVVDLDGARRQAVAATRARARRRGTGPIGFVTGLLYRASGRERQAADPAGYLRGWRTRGSMTRAAAPIRDAVLESAAGAPAELRPVIAALGEPAAVEGRLATAADRAIAAQGELRAPASLLWPVVGIAQTVVTAALVVAAAWIVLWILLRPPVSSVELPGVGSVPVPFLLLAAALVAGYLLARILGLHAGWVGRRWAGRVASAIRGEVETGVRAEAFAVLDRVEAARRRIRAADRSASAAIQAAMPRRRFPA